MSQFDYLHTELDCLEKLRVWAEFNCGRVGPTDSRSNQMLPRNRALDKPALDPREVRERLVVAGEVQRNPNGDAIMVSVIRQHTALGKQDEPAFFEERTEWPSDVERMSLVLGCLKKSNPRHFKLLCIDLLTDHAVEHKADRMGIKHESRRITFNKQRKEAIAEVKGIWNGMLWSGNKAI